MIWSGGATHVTEPKVSIVMATYNTGPRIDWTLAELSNQTMAPEDFEVVVVDDGSSDDTFGRLTDLSRHYSNLVVERIPNSGWPGRPRNVGVGLARGEYVLFMDHDDLLFPQALERLHAFATTVEADVVVPKEVVDGWRTPGWPTWRRNVARAEVDADLLACITPHKLYRRAYLLDREIAFPEGRIRLEDFDFNAQAYARTDRIAIYSEFPCYTWVVRGGNSHKAGYDVGVYWASFERSLQPIVNEVEAGTKQDAMLVRWYRSRMLERLNPQMLNYSEKWKGVLKGNFERLLTYFPEELDQGLTPADRARSALLRKGDWAGLRDLAELDRHMRPVVDDLNVRWEGAALHISCHGRYIGAAPDGMRLRVLDGRVFRVLPKSLGIGDLDVTDDLANATLDLIVRSRDDVVDWNLPTTWTLGPGAEATGGGLEFSAEAVLDPETAAFGRLLQDGVWDVVIRTTGLGWAPAARLPTPGQSVAAAAAVVGGRLVCSYTTATGTLAVDVAGHARCVTDLVRPSRRTLDLRESDEGVAIRWTLPGIHVPPGARFSIKGSLALEQKHYPAWLVPDPATGAALVAFVALDQGEEVRVRPRFGRVAGRARFNLVRTVEGVSAVDVREPPRSTDPDDATVGILTRVRRVAGELGSVLASRRPT